MKNLIIFILSLFALDGMSQISKVSQDLVILDGKYTVTYHGLYFDVDTTIITVKVKDLKEISKEYKIQRKNKLGFVDLQKPSNISIEEYVKSLSKEEEVESIIYSTFGEYVDFIPNDTYLNSQWHLPVINAYKAWDITTGNSNVIVGILDSGTEWTHSDLGLGSNTYQNIHLNPGEDIWTNQNNPSTGNGIDDDNNGFIDDWKGWNYAYNSNDSRSTAYHGTFVAGIVSAKTNNDHGIAGIAGGKNNSGAKLLLYCVGVNAPISSILDDAIIDAVDNGAKVIQLSLSVPQSSDIDAAIQYAINNNVVVVCAAGNNIPPLPVSYPASNTNVISVGATDQNNHKAEFSNYGNRLDVVAPGVDIFSATLNNGYTISSGTSFAAPQVSGIIALMLSVNPYLTPLQIRNIIESNAQKVGGYTYQITSGHPNGTWNEQMGYGLVDAYAAVQAACPAIVNFNNQTITSDTTVVSCGDISVQNVTVTNNAKLTLDAANETIINSGFEVQLGSQLEIK
jgi:subtilisin family serine protease